MRTTGNPTMYNLTPHESTTTQQQDIGAVAYDSIGRKYRYVKAGGVALVRGNLLQGVARSTDFTNMAIQAAAAVGSTTISVTLGSTATTANQFDNGVLVIYDGTSQIGQNFTIRSHQVSNASATCVFTVEEPVQVALTTSGHVTVNENPWSGVIVSPTARTGLTVGVALTAIPIANFGWIGCHGIFGVLSDATVAAVGEGISPSTSTPGCVTKAVTLLERIGTAHVLGVSAKVNPVFLQCP